VSAAPRKPALPAGAALLLDLDGTLLDFAPTPDSVTVPADLPATLRRLRDHLDGALAIVTGRPIGDVDRLLGDAPTAVAGEHGAAIRHTQGAAIERADLPPMPPAWIAAAERLAEAAPGVLLERKAASFVLHYRRAPECGPALLAALRDLMHDDRFTIMTALLAWEVKPIGADKGRAVDRLMACKPFMGRTPIYIGDDVTDEDGMRAARGLGGEGWQVQQVFGSPAGVRTWLAKTDNQTRRPKG